MSSLKCGKASSPLYKIIVKFSIIRCNRLSVHYNISTHYNVQLLSKVQNNRHILHLNIERIKCFAIEEQLLTCLAIADMLCCPCRMGATCSVQYEEGLVHGLLTTRTKHKHSDRPCLRWLLIAATIGCYQMRRV